MAEINKVKIDEVDYDIRDTSKSTATNLENGTGDGALKQKYAQQSSGMGSFAEGVSTFAYREGSHAEGKITEASGEAAHSEGFRTVAKASASHAEGGNYDQYGRQDIGSLYFEKSDGTYAGPVEGSYAEGVQSHTEGTQTYAEGYSAHAEGMGTGARGAVQHVQGKFNVLDSTSAHIVGNGTSDTARSNAHTLDWNGNAWFAGDVYVGSTSGTNKDEGSKILATQEYVQTEVTNLVNSAPDKLNTLDELAAALGDDENFATTVTNKITSAQTKADDAYNLAKQNKITGTAGQIVGFDINGNAVAQEAPAGAEVYNATIGTSWTEDENTGVKSQTVSIQEITSNNTAKVDVYMSHNPSSEGLASFVEEQNQFLDYITNGYAKTINGGIKFYIFGDANTVNIPIVVEVV